MFSEVKILNLLIILSASVSQSVSRFRYSGNLVYIDDTYTPIGVARVMCLFGALFE